MSVFMKIGCAVVGCLIAYLLFFISFFERIEVMGRDYVLRCKYNFYQSLQLLSGFIQGM